MHSLSFQYLGLNAVYVPFPVLERDLPSLLNALSVIGVKGLNVTVPYKERIVPFLDELSPAAETLGSVNTILRNDSQWKGFSTDGAGFVRSAKEEGINFKDKTVILYGGGGSAKAIALAIAVEGISQLAIVNRTKHKAQKIAEILLGSVPSLTTTIDGDLPVDADILINSTSVGMKNEECPVADEQIKRSRCIIDIIYNPPETPLIRKAKTIGIPAYNGMGMLLYQGIEAFEIWTGQTAPKEIMVESLQRSMEKTH